jgi:hypothetical protein
MGRYGRGDDPRWCAVRLGEGGVGASGLDSIRAGGTPTRRGDLAEAVCDRSSRTCSVPADLRRDLDEARSTCLRVP